MESSTRTESASYRINVEPLSGRVTAYHNEVVLASSDAAKVMYETRLPAMIYFRIQDIVTDLSEKTNMQTFCPFKGTANYRDIQIADETISNAAWSYESALSDSHEIQGHVGFMPNVVSKYDLAGNILKTDNYGNISGPLIDWLLRDAAYLSTPEEFTNALTLKLRENGIEISRLSVLIWSLHPSIAGKNYVWEKESGQVTTLAPSYEIYDHPAYLSSPLRHVSNGLGGVRHRITEQDPKNSFPIIKDLRAKGASDYVAMPLPFSDGRTNVLTITCDHPNGFSTENLGLIFECSAVISRFYEVFMQRENAQSLLETYVGKRSGARVLGGEIRRGDGDEINAAIMFCDMRNSTLLEEKLGRDDYISLLNYFFETTSTIVHEHGGEILKFIGDAVLAVFPAGEVTSAACKKALKSAREIVADLTDQSTDDGVGVCDCSIGIAFGRVTYGNVGSRERLDFTVVGKAANVAARLCDYGKPLGHRIVATQDVLDANSGAIDLGLVELHNVSEPIHSFAVGEEV